MDIELKNEKSHPVKKAQRRNNSTKRERDKRHEIRKETARFHKTTVKIPLPFPKGVTIVKEVIDLSDQGLAFKMAREEGFLLPGTTIKDLVIYCNGKNVEKPSAEVMYAAPDTENEGFKIGIKFIGTTSKRSALGRRAMTHAVRPIRYDLAKLNQQHRLVTFADKNGQRCSGIIINISPYGLAFELEKSNEAKEISLKLSEMIDHFQVVVGGETLYSGKVTVATIRVINGKQVVGVSLWDKSVDVRKIHNQHLEGAKTGIIEWASTLLKAGKVQQAFKALVADARYFLEAIKTILDEEERKANNQGLVHKKLIERSMLMHFEQEAYAFLDSIMKEFNKNVCDFDEEQHAYHREYFQRQVGNLLQQSPFVKRCYNKPLGYAGDYEMMDMIYRDPYEGDTWFARFLNKYFCHHIPPAQACRNRIPILQKKIEEVVEKRASPQKKARILSVACGPANEVVEFIRNSESSNDAEITLVDIEPEALYFSQEKTSEVKTEAKRKTRINIYYLPLQQLLKEPGKLKELENRNLIYSAGLFDYLSDEVCKNTLSTLYKLLAKDGTLIIGNLDPCNELKWLMEYGAEWYVIHRTQADLRKLAQEAVGSASEIYCETEPAGINNLLIIKR